MTQAIAKAATPGRVCRQSIHVVVTRANGQVEDWGNVNFWHRNPLRRLAWKVGRALFAFKRLYWRMTDGIARHK